MANKFLIEKQWMSHGFPCCAVIHCLGHRNGYVGVHQGHPSYGLHYDEIKMPNGDYVAVHGGLTFAGTWSDLMSPTVGPTWWFGFDCAHYEDGISKELALQVAGDDQEARKVAEDTFGFMTRAFSGEVRSLEFVMNECEQLAGQLETILVDQQRRMAQ